MNLSRGQRTSLMAMYLHAVPSPLDNQTSQLIVTDYLPRDRGSGLVDVALEAESTEGRVVAVSSEFDGTTNDLNHSLVSVRSNLPRDVQAQMRYGEILALATPPTRMPLPSPYHRASERGALHPELDRWLHQPPEIRIAYRNLVVAAGYLNHYESTQFSGSPVYVAKEHRGHGLGKFIVSAAADRIRAIQRIPVALIGANNQISRRTFRSVGYERELAIGVLSVVR
jgi:GNAT superfamily N-acetyltransferase